MLAPLKLKQQNAINAHQFKVVFLHEGKAYKCFRDEGLMVAREEGLRCIDCGDLTTNVTPPSRMLVADEEK